MTDTTILSVEIMRSIRAFTNEFDITKYLHNTLINLRSKGYTEMELIHLIQQVNAQLHSLDPFSIEDSHEWNMISHAKVELFRMGSKMILSTD